MKLKTLKMQSRFRSDFWGPLRTIGCQMKQWHNATDAMFSLAYFEDAITAESVETYFATAVAEFKR